MTMASCTALPLHLYCRLVLHHRTSSPGVIFLRSLKLFVDPAKNTCRLLLNWILTSLPTRRPSRLWWRGFGHFPRHHLPERSEPPTAATSQNEWSTTTSDDARHGRSTTTFNDAWHGRSTTTSDDARHRRSPSATSWYRQSYDVDAAGPHDTKKCSPSRLCEKLVGRGS